ncbi:uncharacterized protein LOC101854055 [Aplysia californica]|uniref:Uncharacterized protein LOC101854055 n=1 Tax=Aplysia californica TaxID=6500 RepID=A0ABM1W2N0_APLCA|nr:uncharacterized protein LOC101854055 [Aplysia californica]XP_035828923.1 uncharacterized protein LOC101854055 [Aplysia californica]
MSVTATKNKGMKKFVMDNKGFIDNLQDHEISKTFAFGNVCQNCSLLCDYFSAGGNLNARDSKTGETFLHMLCNYTHLYLTANGTRIMYLLCTKLDPDVTDLRGDTALHKVVRVPGAWRCIVALLRCGSCPLIKNNAGRTPEDEILHLKNTGWQENLHWLRKFKPGLWAAVKSQNPDPVLIERLLRYWCRTTKIIGKETVNLKCLVHMCETQLDTVLILEKYENTNEMALAMLSGKTHFIDMWKLAENLQKVDINTKDHSYQFYYRDYPTAPRPLMAAVWEIDQLELIQSFMELHPDTSIKYTFESEATSPPKPLFFQLVNPKSRPQNEAITSLILRDADLNIRNTQGQTVLMEAMYNGETEGIIRAILNSGVNVAARDSNGRTARDHSILLKRNDYRELIDSHIIEMVQDCDILRLEALVLQLYEHVAPVCARHQLLCIARQKCSKQLHELLKNAAGTQAVVKKLFSFVKSGNKVQLMRQMTRKYANARDKAGRSLLHFAIQHSLTDSSGKTQQLPPRGLPTVRGDVIMDDISVRGVAIESLEDPTHNSDTTQLHGRGYRCRVLDSVKKECNRFKKNRCLFSKCMNQDNFTPDHVGVIKYLVQEFPFMLGHSNNLGQTPLHYAYIYTANQEVLDLLKTTGSCEHIKDVYDFVPEDYDYLQCGVQTFNVRRKPAVNVDLDIFLTESDFEHQFVNAVKNGDQEEVKKLLVPLLEHGGESRFSCVLFDCLDKGYFDLASFLVEAGFDIDISKQYEVCDPDDPMCAMMECGHASTTFKQRAEELGATSLVRLIDSISLAPTRTAVHTSS